MIHRKTLCTIAIALALVFGLSGCASKCALFDKNPAKDSSGAVEAESTSGESKDSDVETASGETDDVKRSGEETDEAGSKSSDSSKSGDESETGDESGTTEEEGSEQSEADSSSESDSESSTDSERSSDAESSSKSGSESSTEAGSSKTETSKEETTVAESSAEGSAPDRCYQTINGAISNDNLYFLYYSKLTNRLKKIYNIVAEGIAGRQTKVTIGDAWKVTTAEITQVMEAVYYDQPQFFWYSGAYSIGTYGSKDQVSLVQMNYAYTSNVPAMVSQFESVANTVLAAVNGQSGFAKEKYIHDFICKNTTYVSGAHDQCPYQCLVKKTAVCGGYVRAFQYLMIKAGIPCYTCVGTGKDDGGAVSSHAWNMVQLDGQWYYVDTTWDDQDAYHFISYTYFNLNRTTFLASHTAARSIYPSGNGTKYSIESVYGMSRAVYNLMNYSGCSTVLSSVEEYKAAVLPLMAANANVEFEFKYICSLSVAQSINSYKQSETFTADIGDYMHGKGFGALSISASCEQMTFDNSTYLMTDTFLISAN